MRGTHHHTSATLIGLVVMMTLGCDGLTGPTTGAIHVTVSTEGTNGDLDIDGYRVMVDSRTPMAIAVQGELTIAGLAPGRHLVYLDGLASNCYIAAANQRPVRVVASASALLVAYKVQCIPGTGGSPGGGCGWYCYDGSRVSPATEVRP